MEERQSITYIGLTNFRNGNIPFGIKETDRTGHMYAIGRTGAGKSTLLLTMAIDDIQKGKGVAVIDPHGDLSHELLDYIPSHRRNDVVYFNATDEEYPIAFNPLQYATAANRYLVASNIVAAFKKVWHESWGPRLEHIFRNAVLTLTYYPNSSLLDIQPLLTNYSFRKEVIRYVLDTAIINFWHNEFNPLSPQLKNEFIAPVVNKLSLLQTHPVLRNIIGQREARFRFDEIMDSQKIFIANLVKGILGEEATKLLGSLLVSHFQTAALERARLPLTQRNKYFLYVDEVQSFINLSFVDMLSEVRKYGLCLFITHQYIEQLPEDIRAAIFGNVGTIISFRIGAADAAVLEREFMPVFSANDLITLPRHHIYLKLLIDGTTSKPFSALTLPLAGQKHHLRDRIITDSRTAYAQQRDVVEKELRHVVVTEESGQLQLL